MEFFDFLKSYPEIGAISIAIVSGSLGWILRNVAQFIMDRLKHRRELETFFWKEKLDAAKKASEYYLEHMNYLNLLINQFENFEKGDIEHQEFHTQIVKEVEYYSEKLKSFPHFKHHHINIFYEFDEERSMELNSDSLKINRESINLIPKPDDSLEVIELKKNKIKNRSAKLRENYQEHINIYKAHLKNVREDIKKHI
jgi:hypothetical protein